MSWHRMSHITTCNQSWTQNIYIYIYKNDPALYLLHPFLSAAPLHPQKKTTYNLALPLNVVDAIKSNTAMNVLYQTQLLECVAFCPPPPFMLWHFLSPEYTPSLCLAINCLNSIIRKQLRGDREKLTLHFTLKAK